MAPLGPKNSSLRNGQKVFLGSPRGPLQYVVRSIPMFESRLLRIGPIQARCKCSDILLIALESKEGW